MLGWWDTDATRWEREFDAALASASRRHLADSLGRSRRLRAWQRRQPENGLENHSWHEAELLWLEGIVLERAGQSRGAAQAWARLADLYCRSVGEAWLLPRCHTCRG